MKKILLFSVLMLVLSLNSYAQVTGDYGSKATGNWVDLTTWLVFGSSADWSDASAATIIPPSSSNVWIRSGHTVTMDATSRTVNSLTVNGTLLFTDASKSLTMASGLLKIDGTFGTATTAPIVQLGASGTISGAGTFYFAKLRPNAASVKITLGMDATNITGASSVINCNVLNNFTLEVSALKTLTLSTGSYISVASNSSTSDPTAGQSLTINVYGTLTVPCATGGGISLANKTSFTSTLNVYNGGTVNTGRLNAVAGGTADANAININISSGGTINLTTASPALTTDMTKSNMNILGTFNPGVAGTMSSVTLGNVILNNGANVTFVDPTVVAGSLTLTSGKITLKNTLTLSTLAGGSASNCFVFDAAGTGSIALNVPAGTSSLFFPVGTLTNYTPLALTYTTAPFVPGKITLKKVTPDLLGSDIISPLSDAGYAIARFSDQYWSFTNTSTGGIYNLSLDGSSGQIGITDPANLRIIHSADGTTFDLVGTHAVGSGSTGNRTGIPDGTSGRFYLGGQNLTVNSLPVELSSFTSNLNGRNVQLNWETKTEKNSQNYVIERSLSGNAVWAQVGTVRAAGNTNSPKLYSFTEKNLQAGQYNYRLKMVDNDGKYEYSKTVEALVTLPKNFELDQNYPNPFNPSTKINYNLPNDSKVTLDIYNIIGERVVQLVNQDQAAGFYSVDFSNSSVNKSLSSGIYLYRIHAVDNTTGKDFSSIKKMILMK